MNKTKYNEEKFVEKYPDPTAAMAIENINRENKKNQNRIQGHRSRSIGKSFEEVIDISCKHYENIGMAIIEKTPEPMKVLGKNEHGKFQACFEKKAQPDYKGVLYKGKAVIFEAKATEKDRIKKDAITPGQFESLDSHWKMQAIAFVLVSFQLERYYRVPWEIWRKMETVYGRKYLKETDLTDYKVRFGGNWLQFLTNIMDEEK